MFLYFLLQMMHNDNRTVVVIHLPQFAVIDNFFPALLQIHINTSNRQNFLLKHFNALGAPAQIQIFYFDFVFYFCSIDTGIQS